MLGNLYFIFLFLTIYFFFVKRNSICAISDQICYKTLKKNIKNKIYKFRRQSLAVYIPNDDRPCEYFENQSAFRNTWFEIPGRSKTRDQSPGPDREGSFRSRESFWSLDRSHTHVSCSNLMTQSKWLKPWQSRIYKLVAGWRVIGNKLAHHILSSVAGYGKLD